MERNNEGLTLTDLAPGVSVRAEHDGVWVRGWRPADAAQLSKTRLGRLLDAASAQMLEAGLAESIGTDLLIPFDSFVEFEKHEIDAFEGIVPPAPFTLTLDSSGGLGAANFKYHYRFYSGNRIVYPRRAGCFIEHNSKVYRVD